jgi:rod shape-determining protein MreC
MESFFSRYKNALVLMLVVLAQVVLLAMQVRRPAPDMPDGHNVRLWRSLVAGVVAPPGRLAHGIGLSVRGVWSNYINLRHLREKNESLQAENDRLRLEQASLAEDARAGQRLREMLDFRGRYIDKTLPSQVVGTSGTDTARVILIDKGYKDGLQVQMPVITPDGIVGKVKNVFPHTAQVLLISDQTSGTGVVLQTTRIRGVMKGNASGQPQMINISPDERIQPGEPVVTSGGDQVYPPGMPVGVVDRVVADPDTSYVNVVIKPNADLSRLEEVLIVTAFSDKMPFAQERDIQQSEVDAEQQKQRAADILSEKLPSIRDANTPDTVTGSETDSEATAGGGDPARPMRPPSALHPDRYSPGAAPPAESLTPGAAPPGLHRETSTEASLPAVSHAPKATTGSITDAGDAAKVVAPTNRYPPKAGATATASSAISTGAGGTTLPGSTAVKTPATGTASTRTSATGTTAGAGAGGTTGTTPVRAATAAGTSPSIPKPLAKPTSGLAAAGTPASVTTTSGVGGSTRPSPTTSAGQPLAANAPKRPVVSSESTDGILTPAGMGTISATPRPAATAKPAVPKTTPGTTTTPTPKTHNAPSNQPTGAPPGGA